MNQLPGIEVVPKAIVFDMDGLLIDSEPMYVNAERTLIERRGDEFSQEVRMRIVGMRATDVAATFYAHFGWQEPLADVQAEFLELLHHAIDSNVVPKPGAETLLGFAREQVIPTAIASSSPLTLIQHVVDTFGWQDYFQAHCSAELEEHGKPAPDVYLSAASSLQKETFQCLALEDSPRGARAAVAAGMTCFAVPDASHASASDFAGITPHIYQSLTSVQTQLEQLA